MSNKPNLDDVPMHMPEGDLTPAEPTAKTGFAKGPIIIFSILLLLAILGGMYWWYATKLQPAPAPIPTQPIAEQNNEPESTTAEAQVQTMNVLSSSDELSAIEADLESTNLDSLDTELNAIEAELQTAE